MIERAMLAGQYSSLLVKINRLLARGNPVHLAIEGMSCAGKSTLAIYLAELYQGNVLPLDHFFLPQILKTPERLSQPGGNIHYERLQNEVLDPLKSGAHFQYRPFDCKLQALADPVVISPRRLNIVEGVYSLHPFLDFPYDCKIFLSLDPGEQKRRCLERNRDLYQRYLQEWIPLENQYFHLCRPQNKCDFVF